MSVYVKLNDIPPALAGKLEKHLTVMSIVKKQFNISVQQRMMQQYQNQQKQIQAYGSFVATNEKGANFTIICVPFSF